MLQAAAAARGPPLSLPLTNRPEKPFPLPPTRRSAPSALCPEYPTLGQPRGVLPAGRRPPLRRASPRAEAFASVPPSSGDTLRPVSGAPFPDQPRATGPLPCPPTLAHRSIPPLSAFSPRPAPPPAAALSFGSGRAPRSRGGLGSPGRAPLCCPARCVRAELPPPPHSRTHPLTGGPGGGGKGGGEREEGAAASPIARLPRPAPRGAASAIAARGSGRRGGLLRAPSQTCEPA